MVLIAKPAFNLTGYLPKIKRARDFHLYDLKGKRYVDLFRAEGSALLGHKPLRLVHNLKQILEKGLLTGLPSKYENQVISLLRKIFPAYQSFLFSTSLAEIDEWIKEYSNFKLSLAKAVDPLVVKNNSVKPISLWWPFSGLKIEAELLLPVLPFNPFGNFWLLCCQKSFCPLTKAVSPFLLAGLKQSLILFLRQQLPPWFTPQLFIDSPIFSQQGIYLIPKLKAEAYKKFFLQALEKGFLFSPFYPASSILPFELSKGELVELTRILFQDKIHFENDN